MSIPFSGTFSKTGGLTAAIAKQLKLINLKPVKKVLFKFDPFHEQTEEIRYFMYHFNSPKVLQTNLNCTVKTEIVCDRSEPLITFLLVNGETVEFKSSNLNALEMLKLFNNHITVLAPKDDLLKADKIPEKKTTQNKRRKQK